MNITSYQDQFLRAVRFESAPPELVAEVEGGGTLSPIAAIDVYRKMYWYRLVDAHFALLPRTARLMGARRFTQAVCACLARQPSRTPVLERLAEPFATYLASSGDPAASRRERELASLEAAALASLLAPDPDGALLTRQDTQSSAFAETTVRALPSLHTCIVQRATLDLYERLPSHDDDFPAEPADVAFDARTEETGVVFVRPTFHVLHFERSPDEIPWLGRAKTVISVGEFLVHLSGPTFDATQAFHRLASYIDHAWLVREEKE